jgi:hypothetical protein
MQTGSIMKRFLVFSGEYYESMGGWGDFSASFSDKDEAIQYAKGLAGISYWAHVVDLRKKSDNIIFYK